MPDASALIGFRKRLVHVYEDVDDARVYRTMRDELGDIERVLAALETAAPTRVGHRRPLPNRRGGFAESGS